jgi:putative DNA primase/helicase
VDLAERLQVPPDYPAVALTVMLAGALGRRAWIRPQQFDNWVLVPNLWGAIIGRSGIMKSTCPTRSHGAAAAASSLGHGNL